MTISQQAILAMAKKVIKLTEKELKDGKHQGNEAQVKEILEAAKKITEERR